MNMRPTNILAGVVAIALAAAVPLSAQQPAQKPAPMPVAAMPCDSASGPLADVVQKVCRVNATWDAGNLAMNPAIIAPILDGEFFWVTETTSRSKEQVVAIIRDTDVRFAVYESSEVKVWLTSDMAIATGISTRRVRQADAKTERWRFTRVFVRRGDQWLVLTHQYLAIPVGS